MTERIDTQTEVLNTHTDTVSRRITLLFAVILIIGLGARLANLGDESIWWDEFATVAFLEPPPGYADSPHYDRWNQMAIRQTSPSLRAFLKHNRELDPAAMPLYLTIEYYWNRYVHTSVLALRLLSVLIGMAILPLIYFTGKRLFNAYAGLTAMFCLAMSPIHVQFAKEIRMYGLMTLLAMVSVLAFIHIREGGKRRWWGIYAVTVLLLSWTHPFALLLPFVQGLFWLTAYPRDIRRLFIWGALTAAMMLPAAAYVLTIQFWEQDSTAAWMRLPTIAELINDIFADDAIGATYQVNATPTAWALFVGEEAARWIVSLRFAVGRFMVLIVALATGGLLGAMAIKDFRPKGYGNALSDPAINRFKWSVFLVMWLVLPPLLLYAVSVFWRPCIMPRYTVHSSLALYLIMGGALAALPRKTFRVTAVIGLLFFSGYQQMLMVGDAQHPDWRGTAATIRERANTDDLVLVHNWLWKRVFAFNLGPVPNVVSYGTSYDMLAEISAFFLDLHLPSRDSNDKTRQVWIAVRTDYFETGTIVLLERALKSRGLSFDVWEFGGIQRVILYHVWHEAERTPPYGPAALIEGDAPTEFGDLALEFWRAGEYETAVLAARNAVTIDPDYARAWSYMGMAYKEMGAAEAALEAFGEAVGRDMYDYPWSHVNIAMLLVELERYDEAVNAALRALEVLPDDAWAYAMLGQAYHGLGEGSAARTALRNAVRIDPNDMRIRQMLDVVEETGEGTGIHE